MPRPRRYATSLPIDATVRPAYGSSCTATRRWGRRAACNRARTRASHGGAPGRGVLSRLPRAALTSSTPSCWCREEAQTMAEYAVVLAVLTPIVVLAFATFGNAIIPVIDAVRSFL